MSCVAPQLFVVRGVDTAWRQLGDCNRRLRSDRAEDAGDPIAPGGGSVENRHAWDADTVEFQIGVNRIETIEREFLDRGCCAEADGLLN